MAKTKAEKNKTVDMTEATADEKKKALETALAGIDKKFGKGSVIRMSERPSLNVTAISTGSFGLDVALGVGGIPRGRITEIYGPESSGKTTLALHCVAEAQKAGGTAAYIDAEHAMDPVYAKALGVNIDDMLISQPDSGEQALEICDALVRSGAIDIVVIDSVAALVPQKEIDGDMGDSSVGLHARLMSQAMRKLSGNISKTNTVVIFINQIREKVGVMFGSPETTTGGRALKFYASVRIEVRKGESLKEKETIYGNKVKCKVAKNKVAPPFKNAEFDIIYGKGIYKAGEICDAAVSTNIIEKSGSWFSYNGERIGQGRDNACAWLEEHPETVTEIEAKLKENLDKLSSGEESDDDDDLLDDALEDDLDITTLDIDDDE